MSISLVGTYMDGKIILKRIDDTYVATLQGANGQCVIQSSPALAIGYLILFDENKAADQRRRVYPYIIVQEGAIEFNRHYADGTLLLDTRPRNGDIVSLEDGTLCRVKLVRDYPGVEDPVMIFITKLE